MDSVENQEKQYLDTVKKSLQEALKLLDFKIEQYKKDIKDDTTHYGEHRNNMDHVEKMHIRQIIEYNKITLSQTDERKKRITKLLNSPYFGRVDFKKNNDSQSEKIYIGIHNFYDDLKNRPVVYDWRAPISSLFYEYESGPAQYLSPSGVINGEVLFKRQFRIRNSEMEFVLESNVNITDDVLQEVLSRASDEGMKNIVATIQRDQNLIIRNENAQTLIIQGVAGSGKTSIALHRIAFLLYRFKETLNSKDILIISPNRVFADYISNVLPELGEESVAEIQMETMADEILDNQYDFQTFFEQSSELLEDSDVDLRHRIQFKSSPEFLKILDNYADSIKKDLFIGRDTWIARHLVPGSLFDQVFKDYEYYSKKECMSSMVSVLIPKIESEYRTKLTVQDKTKLRKAISEMHSGTTLLETYKNLFIRIEKPELFNLPKNGVLEYADVFPMVYLKIILEPKSFTPKEVKHLLIDEMQDYTPVQYAVIAKLFKCSKTILGDANQSVNPYSSSTGEVIRSFFSDSLYVTLNKSYRSSYEIMQFVQKISPNTELELIERHGEVPQVFECQDAEKEIKKIIELAKTFKSSEHNTLGVICKTQSQAKEIFEELLKAKVEAHLFTSESTKFDQGIIVCNAHMAKGLEFDQVIVPGVNEKNYNTSMDKNLLYVACTRAMHSLALTYHGKRSLLLPN